MQLQALTPSTDAAGWPVTARDGTHAASAGPADRPCAFCGVRSGAWQLSHRLADGADTSRSTHEAAACPLCALALHLERPCIDDEAILVWLPEMSQQALNTLLREIHMQLRSLGESLHPDHRFRIDTPERRTLHHARAVLAARSNHAVSRLGTAAPSELSSALLRLSPKAFGRRGVLLGGLRLLPLGRFYVACEDVYPSIVDTWLELARSASSRSL